MLTHKITIAMITNLFKVGKEVRMTQESNYMTSLQRSVETSDKATSL